jgi:hypothetical protein
MLHTRFRRTASLLLLVAPVIGLTACGGGGTNTALSVKETEPGKSKYKYEGLAPVTAGTVTVKLTNKGKAEHELQIIKADGNRPASEVKAALTKLVSGRDVPVPDWLHAYGGVAFVKPGKTGTSTEVLAPGRYYVADTNSPDSPQNAPPYITQGAFGSFEVKQGKSNAPLPRITGQIKATDVSGDRHAFEVTGGLKVGQNNLVFDNASKKEDHHFVLVRLLPGKTLADAKKALASQGPPKGQPPIDFPNAVGSPVLDAKFKDLVQINVPQPGNYALLCFLQDRNGKGPPHFLKGMLKEIKIS